MDLAVYWDGHLCGDNVILRIRIMGGVQPKEILVSLADHVGMSGTKFAIRPRVAEVEGKLTSLHLHRHGVSAGRLEIDIGPSLGAECSQRQDLGSYQKKSRDHQTHGPAGEIFNRLADSGLRKLPYKNAKQNLRCQEKNSSLRHRLRHLLVNRSAVTRNIFRSPPCVSHNGDRGEYRNNYDGDRE